MTYSLAVKNGDLVQLGGSLGIVYGIDKLKQDLCLWLLEQYGIDRFHPNLGSILQSFIGGVVNAVTQSDVHSEILRVLQNYQAIQLRGVTQTPSIYSLSELLYAINTVDVKVGFDTVTANCNISNAEGQSSVIAVAQSLSGATSSST